MNSGALLLLRFFFFDVLWDVVRFPVWWYERGVTTGARWWMEQITGGQERLALIVLMKNLGRPMFGDYTREGRAISFGVRIVQLIVSLAVFAVWFLIVTVLWLAWFCLLPAAVIFLFTLLHHA